jgi:hypothetical protein
MAMAMAMVMQRPTAIPPVCTGYGSDDWGPLAVSDAEVSARVVSGRVPFLLFPAATNLTGNANATANATRHDAARSHSLRLKSSETRVPHTHVAVVLMAAVGVDAVIGRRGEGAGWTGDRGPGDGDERSSVGTTVAGGRR